MKKALHFLKSIYVLLIFAILISTAAKAQWSSPVNISPHAIKASMNENMGPCLVASHDTLHVIWSEKRKNGSAIYYTRSIDTGLTWSTPIAITDTTGKAGMPSLAVNGRNIHVVWWDSLNEVTGFTSAGLFGNSSFYIRSLDGGNTWGGKVCIDSSTVFWPGVAVSGSNVLVSLDKGGFGSTVVYLVKSTDNGKTWGKAQRISTRTGIGRSEDQATATDGKYIHTSWNDNRSGTMQIYYRRSRDMGVTWDNEVALTSLNSYTTMVSLDSGNVDIPHGLDNTYWNSWIRQSSDSGTTWKPDNQVTNNTNSGYAEEYPFLVREGLNLHITSVSNGNGSDGIYYSYSGDGGATWAQQVLLQTLNNGGWLVPFIALTCPVLHVVSPYDGAIYYMRNPTGNPSCPSIQSGIKNVKPSFATYLLYPNPTTNNITIETPQKATIDILNVQGQLIKTITESNNKTSLDVSEFPTGVYIIEIITENKIVVKKVVKE